MSLGSLPTTRGIVTFSRRPDEAILAAVASRRVDLWWNVARELADAVPTMREVAATVRYLPLRDYHVPEGEVAATFMAQLDEAVALLGANGHVHVSCYGGRGRTGLALACIAMALEHVDASEALRRVHAACGGPETAGQIAFVREFAPRRA